MEVGYTCEACGAGFALSQGSPEPDEDVSYCGACIQVMVTDPSHGSPGDPWTRELVRRARGLD